MTKKYTAEELLSIVLQSNAQKYVEALLRERVAEKIDALFVGETLRWEREVIFGTGKNEPRGLLSEVE